MLMDKAKQKHIVSRCPKTTRLQYGIMVDALAQNSEINWDALAKPLNDASSSKGPRRSPTGWRRVFTEWKCNVKKRARNISQEGSPQLTMLELRLLNDKSVAEEGVPKLYTNLIDNRLKFAEIDTRLDVGKRRARRTKPRQYEIMLKALQENKLDWENLTLKLNTIAGGPVKTPDGWRRVFNEWKCNVKKKARNHKGDPYFLSDTEKKLLLACGVDLLDTIKDPFELSGPSEASTSSMTIDNIFKIEGEPFQVEEEDILINNEEDYEEPISIDDDDYSENEIPFVDSNENMESNIVTQNTADLGDLKENIIHENINLQNLNDNCGSRDELMMEKMDKINTNLEAINKTLQQLTGVLSKLVEKS